MIWLDRLSQENGDRYEHYSGNHNTASPGSAGQAYTQPGAAAMNLDEKLYVAANDFEDAINNKQQLSMEQRWRDYAIGDLLHEIELSPLNAAERIQIFNRLREILRKRRVYKNTLMVISGAKKLTAHNVTSRAVSLSKTAIYT